MFAKRMIAEHKSNIPNILIIITQANILFLSILLRLSYQSSTEIVINRALLPNK